MHLRPPAWFTHLLCGLLLGLVHVSWAALGACLVGLALLLSSCDSGDEGGSLSPPTAPSLRLEQQAVGNLLRLYRTAVIQEDADRLEALLQPAAPLPADVRTSGHTQIQAEDGALMDVETFLEAMTTTFRTRTVLDLHLPEEDIQIAEDRHRVTFLEAESTIDPVTLEQQTHAFQTTFQLTQEKVAGVITFRITGVRRDGPVFQVIIPGQVRAGTLTRVEVSQPTGTFPLAGVEITVPETGAVQTLVASEGIFHGFIMPPAQSDPAPFQVRLQGNNGDVVVLQHRYRLRVPGEGVVQKIAGTGATARFFAVAVAPDGAVWGGGTEPLLGGGTLYRVPPGATTAVFVGDLVPLDPADPVLGRVEDMVFDQLGRLHTIVFAPRTSGDIVFDQGVFCQTVNAFDPAYPFLVPDAASGRLHPSASTRAVAAGVGDVWLFGSDAGVARVADAFRNGQCPEAGVAVRYNPIFQREAGGLLSNTVPALVVGEDATLWFGTAFGLTRLQNGRFTPVPFDPALSLQGDVATLEAFFQALAEAIFAARPLSAVRIGEVSFVETFGSPLVKEDLILSAVEDTRGRLWVGTLGGGIRCIEASGTAPQETLHLTRQDGLSSNIIFALAVGPDESLWAATEEGISRIREVDGEVLITTFSALDGLALPVRDVAIDAHGIVWLATDGGLFRIVP